MGYADKLRKLCATKGLDQSALAERVGVSKSSMSRILSGAQEPKLRLAYELARALETSLDYLVDDTLEDQPQRMLVQVSEDEWTILKIVRRLGTGPTIDRLLGVESPAPPPAELPVPEARRSRKRFRQPEDGS